MQIFSRIRSEISIHAPARGATAAEFPDAEAVWNFNPRSREGSDAEAPHIKTAQWKDFNPRSREGSDLLPSREIGYIKRFQSTLPRGERLNTSIEVTLSVAISIHAPARGATCCHGRLDGLPDYFNPRSREGSDIIMTILRSWI